MDRKGGQGLNRPTAEASSRICDAGDRYNFGEWLPVDVAVPHRNRESRETIWRGHLVLAPMGSLPSPRRTAPREGIRGVD